MIVLAEEPDSPNERSPLKGESSNPTSPISSPPAPPPTYAAALAAPAHTAHIPSYHSVTNPHGGAHGSEERHSHRRGSPRRGRRHGGRHGSPGRSRSSSPHRRPSTLRRFSRALLLAFLVIILWGMFLDTLGDLVGSYGVKVGNSVLFSGSGWLSSLYRDVDPAANFCSCQSKPVTEVPGRVMPIQYPPVISKIVEVSALPVPSARPSCQYSAGASQTPAATPIGSNIYTFLPVSTLLPGPDSRIPPAAGS
ncbi:hypothetical protein CVT25_010568 [Psilocybe cyanescens]|uniref:Uncharacterized protein n=1 Tax=Psilocybe cyanescens TaxID=93625 RepID=A0A409WJB9_PSICY|nr:hypothetical protein CVT25_010568 [Psilocybe cyanescens]